MTVYFFHMETRGTKFHEDIGKECASLSAAHDHALRLIRSTTRYVRTPRDERWMIEVCSDSDTQLHVLFPVSGRWWGPWHMFSKLNADERTRL